METESRNEPVRIIFDTDIGNDIDDALALALLHTFQSRAECRLLAVTITKDNTLAAPFVDVVNTFYGRGTIPLGMVRNGVTPEDGNFLRPVLEAETAGTKWYPRKIQSGREAPEAVELLRKVLSRQPDGSVVIVQVGFSTNLARLLKSQGDSYSPLTGMELVKQKVRLLSIMAGAFTEIEGKPYREYNVVMDLDSSRQLFENWPVPIVASGFEIGLAILYPAQSIEEDYRYVLHHPVAQAYRCYMKMPYDRPTWDLTSVLYAVRPQREYFDLSEPGTIQVDEAGHTIFTPQPAGRHRYLMVKEPQIIRVTELFTNLCSQPPDAKP
ncbi:MAG: ribonucleoside hydrolase RihC [Planctomycetes bacterium ADurb.Bin412]|nr:MAG: ribonucleoside hydrolase RihC [Planctomycetes bacterium ADurb.Bin412]